MGRLAKVLYPNKSAGVFNKNLRRNARGQVLQSCKASSTRLIARLTVA